MEVDSTGSVDLVEVKTRHRRSFVRKRYVETMIVADETMYKAFGGDEIELRSYLLSLMAIVSKTILLHYSVITLTFIPFSIEIMKE